MTNQENPLRRLELPRRWELLAQRAESAQVDPSVIVEPVEEAGKRVDALLRRVRDGGGGVIEVFFGLSGSGKTTFLKTLPKFFDGISVSSFPDVQPLRTLPEFIRSGHKAGEKNRIVLIERRDNPTLDDLAQVEEMFAELLNVFREPGGEVVVLWPITNPASAERVAGVAWKVGRDSMADAESAGQFHFRGVNSARYWALADNTSRTLTGDGLEAFGITELEANKLLPECETISDYFARLIRVADSRRDDTWSILKKRAAIHLWVCLPGDETAAINATADALTQGSRSKIDIDKIGELIDQPKQTTIYIAEWKERRGELAHLLRAIDVRLFAVPPNVSLAAVRSFGDPHLKGKLRSPSINLDAAKETMKSSRLYKAILQEAGVETTPFAGLRSLAQETVDEFKRVQVVAASNDKPLNKALGALIEICLKDDAPNLVVISEKKALPGTELQPDIQIQIAENEFICIEPTWRTTGAGIEGEIPSAQNTLSEAHMKKYLLEKATQYVKGLGL